MQGKILCCVWYKDNIKLTEGARVTHLKLESCKLHIVLLFIRIRIIILIFVTAGIGSNPLQQMNQMIEKEMTA